jgi:glycerol-3-phosphate acyltransferase PlsY
VSSTDFANFAVVIVASYLFGSIPTGYLAGRMMRGIDIRDYGSGATGATNVLRVLGRGPFVLVMIADALKGYIPAMVVWLIFESYDLQVAAGLGAVIGHDFPIYIGFHGGRGVATTFGVYAAMALPVFVGLVAVGIFILLALRYMSVMSIITVPLGTAAFLLLAILGMDEFNYTKVVFGLFATALVLVTHWPNIKRLIRGTEPKFGETAQARAPEDKPPRQKASTTT